jgi:HPt (histidine-containing phosphotransfer) domain-containing protein
MNLSIAENTILFDPDEFKHYPKEALEYTFLSSLFDTFSESSSKLLSQTRITIQEQDLEQFKNHMHALKGIAGNVKAKRLAEIANHCLLLDTETFLRKEETQEILDILAKCIIETNQALRNYLEKAKED